MRFSKALEGALLTMLAAPLPIQAAQWSAEPTISLRTGYNDNIRLTTVDHDSVWETDLTPAVKFGVATENQGLFGKASASIRRFSGGSGRESSSILDREDYYLKTDAYHKTPRNEFKANLYYTRDSTLDSELDETGNVIEDRATRERISLGPAWETRLTETTWLQLGYQYTDVTYSDDFGIDDKVDYKYDVFSASLSRQLTPRVQGVVSASYSSYQPEPATGTGLDSDTVALQAGIRRDFSETLSGSLFAGARKTTSDTLIELAPGVFAKDENDNNGSVFSAELSKRLETGNITASLSRSTNPSSNGTLLDTTRVILTGEHKFTETLQSSLRVSYSENETIVNRLGVEPDQDNETFFRIRPKLSWHWRREWTLAGEYEYAENENVDSRTATRNAFYLTLTYRPPKQFVSR